MSKEQIRRALNAFDLRERLTFRMAVFDGMRPGEILAVRPLGDIGTKEVHIKQRCIAIALATFSTRRPWSTTTCPTAGGPARASPDNEDALMATLVVAVAGHIDHDRAGKEKNVIFVINDIDSIAVRNGKPCFGDSRYLPLASLK
jgi:hypothetical protein